MATAADEIFDAIDANRDGMISLDEFRAAYGQMRIDPEPPAAPAGTSGPFAESGTQVSPHRLREASPTRRGGMSVSGRPARSLEGSLPPPGLLAPNLSPGRSLPPPSTVERGAGRGDSPSRLDGSIGGSYIGGSIEGGRGAGLALHSRLRDAASELVAAAKVLADSAIDSKQRDEQASMRSSELRVPSDGVPGADVSQTAERVPATESSPEAATALQAEYHERKEQYHQVKTHYDDLTSQQASLYGLLGQELTHTTTSGSAQSVRDAAVEAERAIRRLMRKAGLMRGCVRPNPTRTVTHCNPNPNPAGTIQQRSTRSKGSGRS